MFKDTSMKLSTQQILDIFKTEFGENFWASFHEGSARVCKSNSKKVYKSCYKLSEKSENSFRTCWSEKIKGSEVGYFVLSYADAELLAQI